MYNWNPWNSTWPEAATFYLDPLHGNDSNAGTSPALAWLTYAKAEQLVLTRGQSIAKKVDGQWIPFKNYSRAQMPGVILGYYQQSYTPIPLDVLDFSALTHISHDHVEPNSDGTLNITYLNMTAANSTALLNAAHAAGVKVILSFSDVGLAEFTAAVENNLNTLVTNILQLLTSRGYDGIDVDWERGVTQPALSNFMSVLYPAIKSLNPNLIVSMAVSYSDDSGAPIDSMWAQTAAFTDFMNAMSYDMYPPGQCVTWFNAALFDANYFGGPYTAQVTSAWRHLRALVLNGVPVSKLLHGMPLYGRLFAGNVGTPTSGPLAPRQSYPSAASMTDTYTPYNQVPALYVPADEHWDGIAQTPYLSLVNSDPTQNSYLSYDDPSSITSKCDWTIERGLAGVALWELSLDYFSGRSLVSPLLDAVKCAWPKVAWTPGATPATPGALTVQTVSAAALCLHWPPVAAATTYNVKRSTTSGSGYTTIAQVSAPKFIDATVASGTTYYYVVSAIASGTEGANSPELSVVAAVSSPPAPPTALSISSVTSTSVINHLAVTLTWTGTAASYLVKRATQVSGSLYITLATVTSAGYSDATLAPNVNYRYVVTALAGSLESADTAEALAAATPYTVANLLSSPADLTGAAWSVAGTGTAVASATTLQAASSGISSLLQLSVAVDPNTNYVAQLSLLSPTAGFVTLSVYAPGWTPIPAETGQWVLAGIAASFYLPFNTTGNASVIFELDLDVNLSGALVTITNCSLGVQLPGTANLLPNAADLSRSPWQIGGTGAAVTSATTLTCSTSGVTSIGQASVPVTPNTNYTALLTVSSAVAGGYAVLSLYASGFASTIASAGASLATSNTTLAVNFNSGAQTAVIFELDLNSTASGQGITASGASLSVTPDSVTEW
jgi:GH18 family chitinase